MSNLKMEFYNASSGVVFTLSWANEEEFRLGKAFLGELVGGSAGRTELHPDKPEFYYLENDEQRDALFAFRKKLSERHL